MARLLLPLRVFFSFPLYRYMLVNAACLLDKQRREERRAVTMDRDGVM